MQEFQMRDVPYVQAIGSVLWPVVISRPDAAFTIGILSQFIQSPGQAHWEGVKRVILYLGTTKNLWLMFGGCGNTVLEGCCDADWAGQPYRHSISRYSFHMGAGAITWSLNLHMFIQEIHGLDKLVTLNCNNQGVIMLSKDNKFHTRTKHIDIWYHFI